jgi:outer membrane protein TolC
MSFGRSVGSRIYHDVQEEIEKSSLLIFILILCSICLSGVSQVAEMAPVTGGTIHLKLGEYLQLVVDHNEALQAQMLDAESYRHKEKAEWGTFEPELAASATRDNNRRLNNSLQQSELNGVRLFEEQNRTYDGSIESLVPSGAKIRLGTTLADIHNNLPFQVATNFVIPIGPYQYQTFVGVNVTQPLLKNFGPSVTMANIRLAALDSEIAFQQYRRQLMLVISQAEAAYWNLFFAQEQLKFFDESVGVAQSLFNDSQERLKAGRSSELDVLQAQSGLAERRTKQNSAMQNYYDALGRARTLYGSIPTVANQPIRVTEVPPATNTVVTYGKSFQTAFAMNPDYLIQSERVDQEKVRLGFAKNQLLPELNAKGSYGYNGLGLTLDDSYANLVSQDFPSWSVGLELRIPLLGNIRGRHLFSSAKLTLQEAIMNLQSVQTQIGNAVNTALQKVRGWHQSIESYDTVVRFNENLLKTEIARLDVGKTDARKVLEVEADLFEARQSYADALVQYRRALLELELADGTILRMRGLDIDKSDLRRKTLALLNTHSLPQSQFSPLPPGSGQPAGIN